MHLKQFKNTTNNQPLQGNEMIELIEYCGNEYRFEKDGKEVVLLHEMKMGSDEKITCSDADVIEDFKARWDVGGFDDTPVL
jgi:hypothetical protein